MKQEDKELLLKDLCARLPYGVVVGTTDNDGTLPNFWSFDSCNRLTEDVMIINCEADADRLTQFDDVRPYLFPLSSMTKEQKKECCSLMISDVYGILYHTIESFDYLYKNHIDVRGLIPMGLAMDATNLNIY